MSLFHQNIATLLGERRESQTEIGKIFGLTSSGVSRWLKNTEPDYDTLIALAQHFRISVDDLLKREIRPEDAPARRKAYARLSETPAEGVAEPDASKSYPLPPPSLDLIDTTSLAHTLQTLHNEITALHLKVTALEKENQMMAEEINDLKKRR